MVFITDASQLLCSVGMGPQQFEIKAETCAIDWKNWLRSFELFADASDMLINKKKSWLLHYAGPKVQSIYYNLPGSLERSTRSEKTQYRKAIEALTDYFAPKQNTSYERHIFRSMSQRRDEKIDSFVIRLRTQADRCKFGRRVDENIKDQVTSSCWSGSLRRKILERNHKSLESVMKLCRIFETVANQDKTFLDESKQKENKENYPLNNDTSENEVCNIDNRKRFHHQYYRKNKAEECNRCANKGHKADDENCPAKTKKCERCGKTGHYARKCYTKINNESSLSMKRETVRMIENYDDYDDTF